MNDRGESQQLVGRTGEGRVGKKESNEERDRK